MQTRLLPSTDIDLAVSLLRQGEVVALPTETVYGLAGDATNDKAIEKIFLAKGRPSDHPLIVHIHSLDAAANWAADISDQAKLLAQNFWPGPLTMVFRKKPSVSQLITGGLNTVALRIPDHPLTLEVLRTLDRAVVAPSANAHTKTSPTRAEHVLKTLSGKIAAVIDGGDCQVGIESTIVDMTGPEPVILRPGAITQAMIAQTLDTEVSQPVSHNVKVAGNMRQHYQPEKPLYIRTLPELMALVESGSNIAIIHYSDLGVAKNQVSYQLPMEKAGYARLLYATLYSIDATDVDTIYLEALPETPEWSAINDRLKRAASPEGSNS